MRESLAATRVVGSPDTHSAASMINNDRILANTANLLLVLREDSELLA